MDAVYIPEGDPIIARIAAVQCHNFMKESQNKITDLPLRFSLHHFNFIHGLLSLENEFNDLLTVKEYTALHFHFRKQKTKDPGNERKL